MGTLLERRKTEIYASQSGHIAIKQYDPYDDEPDIVLIPPDDLNSVIEQLHQAYNDALMFAAEEESNL
jgi:hypothetical protein